MASLRFHSLEFKYTGDLPPDSNAGNQFYGEDVAEFIGKGLEKRSHRAAVIDEDWGWLVTGQLNDESSFEVAVYNLNDHGEGGRPGAPEWGLWVRQYRAAKRFGIIPYRKQVPVTSELQDILNRLFEESGTSLEFWADGPGER